MTKESQHPAQGSPQWLGALAAPIAVAVWVILTARTGTPCLLFPFVVASSLGIMSRLSGPPLSRAKSIATSLGGLAAVAGGWFLLVARDETSTATLVADQPGGVAGETAVFAVLGVAFSVWWTRRTTHD